jgi:hypothetical protein
MSRMNPIFEEFRTAYGAWNGYGLSMTLSPVAPASDPGRLYNFYRSTNFSQAQKDIKNSIIHASSSPFNMSADEGTGWTEVYFTYWKAVGEILNAEEAMSKDAKV